VEEPNLRCSNTEAWRSLLSRTRPILTEATLVTIRVMMKIPSANTRQVTAMDNVVTAINRETHSRFSKDKDFTCYEFMNIAY
jgi:hypothetical protein